MYSEIGPLTRASRTDFEELQRTLKRMEMECKNAWDYLKIINKYDNTGAMTQQEQSEQVSGYTMPELPKYSKKWYTR